MSVQATRGELSNAGQLIVPLATNTAGPDKVTRPREPSSFGVMPMRS